jgi:hypothetical protein
MLVVLATQEAEIKRIASAWANSFQDSYLERTHNKKGLVEWLKV